MKKFFVGFLVLLFFWPGVIFTAGKKLTFDQVYPQGEDPLLKRLPVINRWCDDRSVLQIQQDKLVKKDLLNHTENVILDIKSLKTPLGNPLSVLDLIDSSADLAKFLFKSDDKFFLYTKTTASFRELPLPGTDIQFQALSPDWLRLAFVLKNDIYLYDIARDKIDRITHDGSETISNGYAADIYFEEFYDRDYGSLWWSPDGKKIAFVQYNQENVPRYPLQGSRGINPKLEMQFYSKAGDSIPEVKLGVFEAQAQTVRWIPDDDPQDHYLVWTCWKPNSGGFYFQWLNRKQNHLKVLRFDLQDSAPLIFYEEKQKTWIDYLKNKTDFFPLNDGSAIIRSSCSGWFHLYLISRNKGKLPLTSGSWNVSGTVLVDEKKSTVFFLGSREDSTRQSLYRCDLRGKNPRRLTPDSGYYSRVQFSPNQQFFIAWFSDMNNPNRLELCDGKGKLIKILADGATPLFRELDLAKKELFRVTTWDKYSLPVMWYLPADMDKNKKYPVILAIYGGPGAGTVRNAFDWGLGNYLWAQEGIVVVKADHRGSGHFGKRGEDDMYQNLGKWEIHDYVEVVKYLRKIPFIDSNKIGIIGHSYGGYVSALALTTGAEYFSCGIAGASVIDWNLYDAPYTERYMGLPAENPDAYKKSCVLTYIPQYKGRLRIIHGAIDDNVHMQHTLQLIEALIDDKKEFDLEILPNTRHGFRGTMRIQVEKNNLEFWQKQFFNKKSSE